MACAECSGIVPCDRLISISQIFGGNGTGDEDQDAYAREWAVCPLHQCGYTCDRCFARQRGKCRCGAPTRLLTDRERYEMGNGKRGDSEDAKLLAQVAKLPAANMILPARCLQEAHIYMDVRGAMPCADCDTVETPTGPITVFTVRLEGERERVRFAFRVAEPDGVLGLGGMRGPSKILGPAELKLWSDILAKRNGFRPSMAMAEREYRADEMLTAAICQEEILKFIPPGEDEVPMSAFPSAAAREARDSDGRMWLGALVNVVGVTYRRGIAESGCTRAAPTVVPGVTPLVVQLEHLCWTIAVCRGEEREVRRPVLVEQAAAAMRQFGKGAPAADLLWLMAFGRWFAVWDAPAAGVVYWGGVQAMVERLGRSAEVRIVEAHLVGYSLLAGQPVAGSVTMAAGSVAKVLGADHPLTYAVVKHWKATQKSQQGAQVQAAGPIPQAQMQVARPAPPAQVQAARPAQQQVQAAQAQVKAAKAQAQARPSAQQQVQPMAPKQPAVPVQPPAVQPPQRPALPPEIAALDPANKLALWVTLAFFELAWADGKLVAREYVAWKSVMTRMKLPDLRGRYTHAQLHALIAGGVLHGLSSDLADLPIEARTQLAELMVEFMAADSHYEAAEVEALRRICGWMGLQVRSLE